VQLLLSMARWRRQLKRWACAALTATNFCIGTAFAGQAMLSWTPPTQNTDGSALTDLTSYRAYWNCGSGTGYPFSETFAAPATTRTITGLPDDGGTCYFALSAINSGGVESAVSNEASKLLPVVAVGDPTVGPTITWTERLAMAEPTFVEYDESTYSDIGPTDELASASTWQTGDIVLVFGGHSTNDAANQLGTPTVTSGSGTGLTFSLLASVNNAAGSNDTQVFLWTATAAGNGSGAIQSVTSATANGLRSGISVLIYRGSDGLGTPVTLDGSTAKTISVTRAQANSHVALMLADWAQVGDVTVTATPSGTVRHASAEAGQADFFVVTFGDQGATGTTSYGITDHTGTVDMSGIAVEIKGTAGGSAFNPAPVVNYQAMMRAN